MVFSLLLADSASNSLSTLAVFAEGKLVVFSHQSQLDNASLLAYVSWALLNDWGISLSADSDQGSAFGNRKLLKKFDQNFPTTLAI